MIKYVAWDVEKNERIKQVRGISFEEAVMAIFSGDVLGKILHPNQKRYPGQYIYILSIRDYAYVVPFVEDKEKIFLKTVFPSRKYTRDYIEKGGT